MKNCILTGFADEIDPMMQKQYALLHRLGIEYIELRGVNGKNISKLTEAEVSLLKSELDREKIKISAIGSPLGKIKITDDFEEHFAMLEKLAVLLQKFWIRAIFAYSPSTWTVTITRIRTRYLSVCRVLSMPRQK